MDWNLELNQDCTVTIIIYGCLSQNFSQIISNNLVMIITNKHKKLIKSDRLRTPIQRAVVTIKAGVSSGLNNLLRKPGLHGPICQEQCSATNIFVIYQILPCYCAAGLM